MQYPGAVRGKVSEVYIINIKTNIVSHFQMLQVQKYLLAVAFGAERDITQHGRHVGVRIEGFPGCGVAWRLARQCISECDSFVESLEERAYKEHINSIIQTFNTNSTF